MDAIMRGVLDGVLDLLLIPDWEWLQLYS